MFKKLRTRSKVMSDVNKGCTPWKVVYTALFGSLLLNLAIFITLNLSDSRRDTQSKVFLVSNHRPGYIEMGAKGVLKQEMVGEGNAGRAFKSLEDRLKKYKLQWSEKTDNEEKSTLQHSKSTTMKDRILNIRKQKRLKVGTKDDDKREAQRLADERNRRSEVHLRRILNRDSNSSNHLEGGLRNEDIRSKYLVVSGDSKHLDIWLHRVAKRDQYSKVYYEYEDGIVQQLKYVPESYQTKIESLNFVDNFSKNFTKEKYSELGDYLKKELSSVFDHLSHSDAEVISELDYEASNRNGIDKNATNNRMVGFIDGDSGGGVGPDWSMLLKVIYVPDGLSEDMSYGRKLFTSEECPVSACHLTSKPAFRQLAHLRVERMYAMEMHKPPGQIWINWFLESPVNSVFIPQNTYDHRINWTASFRSDSIIVTPYAKFLPHNHSHPSASQPRNYAKGKTRLAAWFVSSCSTTNNRLGLVKRLQKHMPVDIFGACGFLECDVSNKHKCFRLLSTHYKFYLSFENSNCDYYITEKLFLNALQNSVVPVVMGARKADYLKAAPPHSYIHVEDFKNERHLAKYLKLLDNNDAEYNKYLAWRQEGAFVNTKFWCRLCALLQDDHKPHLWYSDFEAWWMSRGTCRESRWN